MRIDELDKTLSDKSSVSDEKDRCPECGCLLFIYEVEEEYIRVTQCINDTCKLYNQSRRTHTV